MWSQLLSCTAGVVDAPLSPVQSQLLTYVAGYQRAVADAPVSPVKFQLLTCTTGCQERERVRLTSQLPFISG